MMILLGGYRGFHVVLELCVRNVIFFAASLKVLILFYNTLPPFFFTCDFVLNQILLYLTISF
jgi:hypothetical protein